MQTFRRPFCGHVIPGLLLAIAVVLTVPTQALAQVEEIVVTARKREENLQQVPLAVTAFTAENMEQRQIRSVDDIGRLTPGLSFSKAFGRTTERPVIRGLGNVLAGVQFGVESGAAYFVDGIYYPGDVQSINIHDIERIEVIKGPQSALYGRNTYSGAINYITKSPGQTLGADATMRYGQDGDFEVSGRLNGPLIPGVLGGGISARYYSFDGEYTNTVTGKTVGDEQSKTFNAALEWTPHEDVRVNLRLDSQNDRDGTRAFFLQPSESNNCFPGTRSNATWNSVSGSTNQNQYFCGEITRPGDTVSLSDGPAIAGQPAPIPGVLDVPFPTFVPGVTVDPYNPLQGVAFSGVDRDLLYVSLRSEWDVMGSGWTLVGSGAWRDDDRKTGSDSDHTPVNYLPGNGFDAQGNRTECILCASERDQYSDYSLEVRLESPVENRLRGLVGAYYYDQDIDGSDVTYADIDGNIINEREGTTNWAIFGSLEYDILENLKVTVEGRYFDEKKTLFQTAGFDGKVDFSEFAPRLTLDWQISDQFLAYMIYAKGYKPGGLNGSVGAAVGAPSYGQESSDNYEVGLKSNFLDNRLIVNLSAFYIDVQDIQLTTPLSNASGQLTSIATNQGSGEVRGFELEASWYLTEALRVGANYALADTEFTQGCDEFQWTLTSGGGVLNDAVNCTGFSVNGSGNGLIKGKAFPLSSKNQVSAFADLRFPVFDTMEFFAGADVSWEDKRPVQVHNLAFAPDATILNARIGIDTGNLSVSIYGRNLTDEDAPAIVTRWLQDPLSGFEAPFQANPVLGGAAPGQCSVPPGTPAVCSTSFPRAFFGDMRRSRNFGVEVAYRFGGDR
ncbi:MAG: TonB-dependent receptor [Gammaproteobacteria bacterium]